MSFNRHNSFSTHILTSQNYLMFINIQAISLDPCVYLNGVVAKTPTNLKRIKSVEIVIFNQAILFPLFCAICLCTMSTF